MKSPLRGHRCVIDVAGFAALLELLRSRGFDLIGPTVRDGAVVLDEIRGVEDLPRGIGDEQSPGHYRLSNRKDEELFGWAAPAHPWKQRFLPPKLELVRIRRSRPGLQIDDATQVRRPIAVIGARPCGVAALKIQDRVLVDGPHPDHDYARKRHASFVLAVNCGRPAGTCFCVSMETGPAAEDGFDLAATELFGPAHRFVIEVGTDAGAEMMGALEWTEPTPEDLAGVEAVVSNAAQQMGRTLDTDGLPERLLENLDDARWHDVAERCLGCANCTMVCPTCFCTTTEDTTDLTGEVAVRSRQWDSCFTTDFAYINGGSVRPSLRARYRQWLTHKLATWFEQFGSSGCVGCGRCITWCPVGIDLTVEAAAVSGAVS